MDKLWPYFPSCLASVHIIPICLTTLGQNKPQAARHWQHNSSFCLPFASWQKCAGRMRSVWFKIPKSVVFFILCVACFWTNTRQARGKTEWRFFLSAVIVAIYFLFLFTGCTLGQTMQNAETESTGNWGFKPSMILLSIYLILKLSSSIRPLSFNLLRKHIDKS